MFLAPSSQMPPNKKSKRPFLGAFFALGTVMICNGQGGEQGSRLGQRQALSQKVGETNKA